MQSLSLRIVDNKSGTDLSFVFNEPPAQLATLTAFEAAPAIDTGAKFVKISADARILPDSATDHAAFYVRSRNIWVTARKIHPKRLKWDKGEAACSALTLCGLKDWRLPDLEDLEAVRDLTKFNPVADTNFLPDLDPAAHWTRTPYAPDPSSVAWVLNFSLGHCDASDRYYEYDVLAVRSGALPGQ